MDPCPDTPHGSTRHIYLHWGGFRGGGRYVFRTWSVWALSLFWNWSRVTETTGFAAERKLPDEAQQLMSSTCSRQTFVTKEGVLWLHRDEDRRIFDSSWIILSFDISNLAVDAVDARVLVLSGTWQPAWQQLFQMMPINPGGVSQAWLQLFTTAESMACARADSCDLTRGARNGCPTVGEQAPGCAWVCGILDISGLKQQSVVNIYRDICERILRSFVEKSLHFSPNSLDPAVGFALKSRFEAARKPTPCMLRLSIHFPVGKH